MSTVKGGRSLRWPIQSLQELIQHFENRLSTQEIERVLRETGQTFICRGAATGEKERLAFLTRCHEGFQGSLLIQEEEGVGEALKTRA